MQIKDMFSKNIDRDIQGVIKVGQDDEENIKQELEEYVVTRELQQHFKEFFLNYKKGINGNTDKMGVWISGFFGSGKSHFLKILSYLLKNKKVEDKKAFEYFLDDQKIKDNKVLDDMKLACNVPTDVVLFNIDAKSKSAGTKGKDSILNVFLKVFNQMQGFSTDPYLADLERQLTEDKMYEKFKNKYEELHNLNWLENRHKFKFHRDKVVQTLAAIDQMSEESARDWSRMTTSPYEISIEEFAQLVKEYLDTKQNNHHIVFLVDEIGQYIGENTDLMLNLQTITEKLGTACRGKAWVVVTSQQEIDYITEVKGNDFSKIQGRFDTRLNLTSANVDEVIKLRILDKTETAKETLSILYENKETIIKNLILFNDAAEKKLYEDSSSFEKVYPFIPYHFNLLSDVLTAIRQHGASGKHLSEGERSMLALFKESAERLMNKEDGEIVSFDIFYDGLKRFLDHSHALVITRALENDYINPEKEEDNFNVKVLKTLFLIKHVKEIEANLENITTLMVSNINQDRIKLKDKVERALRILVNQTLVQKNGDLYIFLTNEEQEINREIERQTIETQSITKKISEMVYAGILSEDKIKYHKFGNRYLFGFNRYVDGESYRTNQNFDIGIDIITPHSDKNGIESNLKMSSQRENKIYVDLPNDKGFIDEIKTEMKIEKYLQISSSTNIPKLEEIKALKRVEMRQHQERGRLFLEEALKDSKIYLNGEKIEFRSKDFRNIIRESLERIIEIVYHKLDYIDSPMDQIEVRKIFKNKNDKNVMLDNLGKPNINAINELLDYIKLRTKNHSKISLKEIKERFKKAPYGFIDLDIDWIISKLFIDGKISFTLNGESISLINETEENIINYITKKQYLEKLLIEEKETIEEKYIRNLKNISSIVFNREIEAEDTDIMIKKFNKYAEEFIYDLNRLKENYKTGNYPGESIIKEGINLINKTRGITNPIEIFKNLYKHEDEYLDFEEDYQPVKSFLKGEQKNIWEKSQNYIKIYEESKSYILNEDIEQIVRNIEGILHMSSPYNKIKDLPELNNDFRDKYTYILEKESEPVKNEINQSKKRVIEELDKYNFEENFRKKYIEKFNDLLERAQSVNNVAKLNGFKIEANTLKMRYLKEIAKVAEEKEEEREKNKVKKDNNPKKPIKPIQKSKLKSINEINIPLSWQIENKEDIDKYISQLKRQIEKELEENTILNIEF